MNKWIHSFSKRLVSFLGAIMFAIGAVIMPVKEVQAALPLLLVPVVINFSTRLFISSVARIAVGKAANDSVFAIALGVAANDASWTIAGSGAVIGRLALSLGVGEVIKSFVNTEGQEEEIREFEIPLAPGVTIKPAEISPSDGSGLSYYNPMPFELLSFSVATGACRVSEVYSIDKLEHFVPPGIYTVAEFISACNASWAYDYEYHPYGGSVYDPEYWYYRNRDLFLDYSYVSTGQIVYKGVIYYVAFPQFKYYRGSFPPSVGKLSVYTLNGFPDGATLVLVEPKDGSKRFMYKNGGLVADSTDPDFTEAELAKFSTPSRLAFSGEVDGLQSRVDISVGADKTNIAAATQLVNEQVM